MAPPIEWHPDANGFMAADRYPFRLLVRPSPAPGAHALFLVLHHPRDAGRFPCAILASGHRDTPSEAMLAAEAVAQRIGKPGHAVGTDENTTRRAS